MGGMKDYHKSFGTCFTLTFFFLMSQRKLNICSFNLLLNCLWKIEGKTKLVLSYYITHNMYPLSPVSQYARYTYCITKSINIRERFIKKGKINENIWRKFLISFVSLKKYSRYHVTWSKNVCERLKELFQMVQQIYKKHKKKSYDRHPPTQNNFFLLLFLWTFPFLYIYGEEVQPSSPYDKDLIQRNVRSMW